jgi:hypothetical protein
MAQTSLNSTGVASSGALSLQSNGTTEAIGISTGQVATLAQNPILTSGTANGVAYLNGSKVLTTGSALVFDGATLGLGTAPSAWNSSVTNAVQLKNGYAALSSNFSIGYGNFSCNAYEDGNDTWKYVNSQPATRYRQNISGVHAWFNAPSGTAGNAITFTQAMTLDASGQLGIGTTSPGNKFHVSSSSSSNTLMQVTNSVSNSYFGVVGSGNVYCWNEGNYAIQFGTNNTERARIDSSGNLQVGMTGGTYRVNIRNSNALLYLDNTFGTPSSSVSLQGVNNAGTTTSQIWANGDFKSATNSYGATSDIKLKENVVDATPKLEKLLQVRVVNYNMIGDDLKQIGVIAQELEQVFPALVDNKPDFDEENNPTGTVTKGVKYSVFVPMLIKAMQELSAKNDALEARIAALEA